MARNARQDARVNAARFIGRRQGDWERLAELCGRAPRAGRREPEENIAELSRLYRLTVVDLARLRTLLAADSYPSTSDERVLAWLNALVARAHAIVHVAPVLSSRRFIDLLAFDFPRKFREHFLLVAIAAGVFVVFGLLTYAACANDLAFARELAGPSMVENAKSFGRLGNGRSAPEDVVMTSFYVSNNVKVAFVCFAAGITAGLGTLFLLVQNGITMGVTVALVHHYGALKHLIAFVSGHAPLELIAIFIAAAAGLRIGRAIIDPGPYRRTVSLAHAARDSVTLVIGAAFLLLVAAFFEGFVSPSGLPMLVKCSIGGINGLLLLFYLGFAGRRASPR
jgi:uncharacterized membrane protein SpoIIM required for sporulation